MMKNTFKKKTLCGALFAGVVAAGISGTASAVYVSPDGTGQALTYPYFTTQDGKFTTFSVTNSGPTAKMVKVRFRESLNSREVLDFNLFLSGYDVWAAAVVDSGNGGAKLILNPNNPDTSCTNPAIPSSGVAFKSTQYTGTTNFDSGNDGADQTLARTKEGYFEIIELGTMSNGTQIDYVTHVGGNENPYAAGVPGSCTSIRSVNNSVDLSAPTNDLFGAASIVDVARGTEVSYDPTAFADLTSSPLTQGRALQTEFPNYTQADPVSTVFISNGQGGTTLTSYWGQWAGPNGGVNAVSATIMHSSIMNNYALDSEVSAGTDWVATFPTKFYYVQNNNVNAGGNVDGRWWWPFSNYFWNGSCDEVQIDYWDREELHNTSTVEFSPVTPTSTALCWEANVITFNSSNVLKSSYSKNIDVGSRPNGWAKITFADPNTASKALVDDNFNSYWGLPVIGFAATNSFNGDLNGVMSNYGGDNIHKTTTDITY